MHQTRRHILHPRLRRTPPVHDASEIFDRLDMGAVHLDRSLRITYANTSAAAILETAPEHLEGKCLRDLLPAPLMNRLSEGFIRALKKHAVVSLEARGTAPSYHWVSFRCMATGKGFTLILENITGKKQAEEVLHGSEANYRAIFDSANDAIFIHDTATGAILDVNRKMTEMYGYTAEETRGLTVGDLSSGVPPYTQEGALEKISETLHNGELLFEWHSKDKSGNLFWEEINLKKALINNETRIVAVARDITERKRTEEALRKSRQSLSILMGNLPGMAYRCRNDTHWTMEFSSEGCLDLTGYRPDDLVGNRKLSYASLIHPDDRAHVWDEIQKALIGRHPFRVVYRIKTAFSQEKWVWEQGRGIFSPEGGVVAVEGFITDITEHRRMEERLRESEQRLVLAQKSGRVGIFDWDIASGRHYWTDEMKTIYHLPHDFDGAIENWKKMVHPDDLYEMLQKIEEAISLHRQEAEADYRIVYPDGNIRWYTDRGVICYDGSGKPVRMIGTTVDITERKQMEERLRWSEERLRLAQQAGRVGVFDWDIVNDAGFFTDEMKLLLGMPPDYEPTTEKWMKITHPDDLREAQERMEHAFREKLREIHGENRITRPDGEIRWLSNHGIIQYDGSGNPVRMIGTSVDITELKKAQESLQRINDELDLKVKRRTASLAQMVDKLQQQKEVLQTIIDNIPVMLVFFDPQGKIRLINKEMEKISGWSMEEARNIDFVAAGFPDEFVRKKILDAIREGRPGWREYESVSRSGKILPCLWTNARLSDGSVIGIGIDITARRKMEQDLQRLATAIEQAGEGIVLLNPDWVIEYVNPAFVGISGYSREELIGRKVDCVRENFLDAVSCEAFDRTLTRGDTWNSHQRRQRKSGEMVEVNLTVSPVRDDRGRVANYVSLVRDVTKEAALRQQMSQSQKLEAIGTLAGGIAHDLKNIFTPIVLNTEIALMDMDDGHPAYPLLKEIQEAARMGADLTRQIVTFSRKSIQEKKPLPVTPIIEEALSFLRSALPATITIHPHLDAGRAQVLADPTQIKQVMINLGNNAGHAMREQGGDLHVELTREHLSARSAAEISPDLDPGLYVRIMVQDTGEGMDEKTLQRIFDPFFTTKDKSEGTGMGLAVVHGIVRDHRGAITVRSTPGKGSAFTVYLPRLKGPVAGKRLTSESPRSE